MRSKHTNNLLRKSPTSLVVEGPPIFMNTMAVGPLEPVASCVTGGTGALPTRPATLAFLLFHCGRIEVAGVVSVARLRTRERGARIAIAVDVRKGEGLAGRPLMKRSGRGQTGHVSKASPGKLAANGKNKKRRCCHQPSFVPRSVQG
jgi:hypothetical protein